MKSNNEINNHYRKQYRKFELTWSPYFHYGIFNERDDLIEAQKQTLDIIADRAQISQESEVLDVGSGIGSSPIYLIDKFKCKIIGIDPIEDQIIYSQTRSTNSNLTFQVGSAENIPFANGSFDVAISNEVLCHVADKLQAFSEVMRVLKNGGYFVFTDLYDKSNGVGTGPFHEYCKHAMPMINLKEYEHKIVNSGFQLIETIDYSKELSKNYERALVRLHSNKNKIIRDYGEYEFKSTKAFDELCLTDAIRNGIGWAMFVCRKEQ